MGGARPPPASNPPPRFVQGYSAAPAAAASGTRYVKPKTHASKPKAPKKAKAASARGPSPRRSAAPSATLNVFEEIPDR